ncbi:FAT4 [Cordylochernes scorpioides]|uniref:FAT4 n=1 Tax=Cordylochernes scorpioides TaxID=51811 RepID=A0ABY6K6C7_9ARAC|nr:FAT4 [Cordylochernes scorpioides]
MAARDDWLPAQHVTVTVLDRNDCPPQFLDIPYEVSVSEEAPVGTTVGTVSSRDPDRSGSTSYSLDSSLFSVDSTSGVVTLVGPLDRETESRHVLSIRADDGLQASEVPFTVVVTDTNDCAPIFHRAPYSFDVAENTARGEQVGVVAAVDGDAGLNGQLSYFVMSDWGSDVFSLNPQTGAFTLISHLDFDQTQHYIVVVRAQDSGTPSLSSTATVYFNVQDVNDNAPLFDPVAYSTEVPEDVALGSSILQVSATDIDAGENGEIVYDIVEGNTGEHFAISANGTVFTVRSLDREVQSFYNLVVRATDQAQPVDRRLSSTVQVSIILKDVNDMHPEFVTPSTAAVLENSPVNTVVMAVKAVDKDEGQNSYIEYSLGPQKDSVFSLGPVDGLLRVNKPLDRETQAQYEVLVIAKDRGSPPKSSSVNIVINVLDQNDNTPSFHPRQYSVSVSENASIGLSIAQVSATDKDEDINGQIRYSIVAGDPNHDFFVAEDTGVIQVSKQLDYERKNRYLVIVQAEDCGADIRTDTATVTIVVQDVNDNPPAFLDSPYAVQVMENGSPIPSSVATITAFDADFLPPNKPYYQMKEGNRQLFHVNSSTGEITVHRALDREEQAEYFLTILAIDSGIPRQTGTGTVRIQVSDANDNPPIFEKVSYKAHIKENLPPHSAVITIQATDKDSGYNGKLKYKLVGENAAMFYVDEDSGTIFTRTSLDREIQEKYLVTLMVWDLGEMIQHNATTNVTILVTDVNDNAPHFSQKSLVTFIPDNAPIGYFVCNPHATDADSGANSRLVYHLAGPAADSFQVDPDSGVIRLVQRLGLDVNYGLELHATDIGRLTASVNITVRLQPSNLFPTLQQPSTTIFHLAKSSAEQEITTISATSQRDPSSQVLYSIATQQDLFRIDPHSGKLYLLPSLNKPTSTKYDLWIQARDTGTPSFYSNVLVEIHLEAANDHAPFFPMDVYNTTVKEELAPPLLVMTLQAEDPDLNENGEIEYALISSEPSRPFTLEAATGRIFTNDVLDREKIETYRLVVRATDKGSPRKSGTATVLVRVLDKNDNPPRFTRLFSVNVTENSPLGTFVIQLTSSDRDIGENANATYIFTENPGNKFHIDAVSGNVTVAGWLDREIQDEYLLKIVAVDESWRAETPLSVTIHDVNDNAPVFEKDSYTFHVAAELRTVASVGAVTATDRDKLGPNSAVTYTLTRPSDLFRVDPDTGHIFTKQVLHYKKSSHRESQENQHLLTVVATDRGRPPLSSQVGVTVNVVDANNHPPTFAQSTHLSPVPYNGRLGLPVLQLVAVDEDTGVNGHLSYSVTGGNSSHFFSINKTTGWITISQFLESSVGQRYTMEVKASDLGVPPKECTTTVHLIVTGENEHAPVFTAFSYQIIIPESEPIYNKIVTVTATDKDPGMNGDIEYHITAGNVNGSFEIGRDTGGVIVIKELDYERQNEYQLNITAYDRSFNKKSSTSVLTIIITDINDNPPLFNSTYFEASLAENELPYTYITQLIATDADSPRNAIIQYTLVGNRARDLFSIDPQTGVLTSKVTFDYEEENSYLLEVTATNPGSAQFSSVQLRVNIASRNEYFPKFVQPVFQFTISESVAIGTRVGILQATDEDTGIDGQVFFLLVGGSNDRGFKIKRDTGEIVVDKKLDRESQARVVLTVMAKNMGSIRGNDTDEAQVVINIEDGNDPPIFDKPFYEARIPEDASPGTTLLTVHATDKDVKPSNNHFTYSIISGNQGHAFAVDPNTGTISTVAHLDREAIGIYNLTVAAIDTGMPSQTDVNDNAPSFEPTALVGYIRENMAPSSSVMILSAKDPDLPPNGGPFTYFLVGGEHQQLFNVDSHTGLVTTTQTLDREATPSLNLLIEVHDSGVPQMSARHAITVWVTDENDCPSLPRTLNVFIWTMGPFTGGQVANVRPLDPDSIGQYSCSLSGNGAAGAFWLADECNLHASTFAPQSATLLVSGNDGRYPDVTSTVNLKFYTFDNSTLQNSISIRFPNQTAEKLIGNLENILMALQDIFRVSTSSI